VLSLAIVAVPGYTDAYYYVDIARHVASGQGLVADFVWSPLEAPDLALLPVPSHRFWMPLASFVQAAGIAVIGGAVGPFRAAQLVIVLIAVFVPLAAYLAARSLGAGTAWSLAAAILAGSGGLFAPAWVTLDSYGIAALFGTAFFLAYSRAARGDVAAGAAAGVLVGALFLARAEAALFGLAPLALVLRPATRRAGLAGVVVALAIGGAWLARSVLTAPATDVFARSALLVRYEDLFALRGPTLSAFVAALPTVAAAKLAALASNALTFAFAFALLPVVGLVAGAWRLVRRPDVRAFVALLLVVYFAQSLVWTLHSTRGSYVHSLAAFIPFGFALACAGGESLLAHVDRNARRLALGASVAATAVISVVALAQFDGAYGAGDRARAAALDAIPGGAFLAIDAAAWRWIADRTVIVTPADGLDAAGCAAARYDAHALVLESAHFGAYDALYRGATDVAWLGAPIDRGAIRIFPISGPAPCVTTATAR
jgi:hypothetical protein